MPVISKNKDVAYGDPDDEPGDQLGKNGGFTVSDDHCHKHGYSKITDALLVLR